MPTPPLLFDRDLLTTRRARATERGDFLHREAAALVKDRLNEVNKPFQDGVVIGPQADLWKDLLGLPLQSVPDTDILNLSETSHDLVIHALALHWANDPVGQLVQMRRALKPDGLALAVLFGGQTLHELRTAFAEAETEIEGGLSPRVAPMGEIRDLGALVQRAGLALPVADSVEIPVSYETPIHLMQDLRAMGETNIMLSRRRTPLRRATLLRACEIYAQNYTVNGRIEATFDLIFLTGWAPHESQQKPLRPGSAQTRLADFLGTEEKNPED